MNFCFTIGILLTIASVVFATEVNSGRAIKCLRSTISAVRIPGCAKEPCQIKKGDKVPVEVDFSFESPKSTNRVDFSVMAGYWTVGEQGYSSTIAEVKGCGKLRLKSCPAVAGRQYTLKINLYLHPQLSTFGGVTTGHMDTSWTLTTADGRDSKGDSFCEFSVMLKVTN